MSEFEFVRVKFDVNKDRAMRVSGASDLSEAITGELGWLHDSGIFVKNWIFDDGEPKNDSADTHITALLRVSCDDVIAVSEGQDLEDAITGELGWTNESGIYANGWKFVPFDEVEKEAS